MTLYSELLASSEKVFIRFSLLTPKLICVVAWYSGHVVQTVALRILRVYSCIYAFYGHVNAFYKSELLLNCPRHVLRRESPFSGGGQSTDMNATSQYKIDTGNISTNKTNGEEGFCFDQR